MARHGLFLLITGACVASINGLALNVAGEAQNGAKEVCVISNDEPRAGRSLADFCAAKYMCEGCEGEERESCFLEKDECAHPWRHRFAWYKCGSSGGLFASSVTQQLIKIIGSQKWVEACGYEPGANETTLKLAMSEMKYECARAYMTVIESGVSLALSFFKTFVDCGKLSVIRKGDLKTEEDRAGWRDLSCSLGLAEIAAGVILPSHDLLYALDTCGFNDSLEIPKADALALTNNVWMESMMTALEGVQLGINANVWYNVKQCHKMGRFGFSEPGESEGATSLDKGTEADRPWFRGPKKWAPRKDEMGRNPYAVCRKYTIGFLEYSLGIMAASLKAVSVSKSSHDKALLCTSGLTMFVDHFTRVVKNGFYVFDDHCFAR